MANWESVANIVQSAITSAALLSGGVWAYFKFISGRVNKPRLELNVECDILLNSENLARIHIKIFLKNVGFSKVTIDKDGSSVVIQKIVKVEGSSFSSDIALESEWRDFGAFSVFEKHDWIEPLETICDEKMIECKSIDAVFKIESFIMAETLQWYSSCISEGKVSD